MNFEQIKALDQEHIMHTYKRFDVCFDHGKGATIWDVNQKEYVDFSSGIGVNSLGFCDPDWLKAVEGQMERYTHMSNLFYSQINAETADLLCQKTGYDQVFFANSGAEANEGAIKLARKYSFDKNNGKIKGDILTLKNSFHGRTITTLMATGQDAFHDYFFPFTPGFDYARANDLEDVKAHISENTCAIMLETIQGEGGVVPLEEEFVQGVAALCKERGILLIADEVQTGLGRTGKVLSVEHYGVKPDIVSLAKGLGGGLPCGAVVTTREIGEHFGPSSHGSTFGGNLAAMAGAKVVLEKLTDSLLQNVSEKGAYLKAEILKLPYVTGVSGKGLMLGISLDGLSSADVVAQGLKTGVVMLTAKEKVRLLPPLTITYEEMEKGVEALKQALILAKEASK